MEAIYVSEENVWELGEDTFDITAPEFEIDYAEQQRAKLYLDVYGMTEDGAVRFYWHADAKGPVDFPVGGPGDFAKAEDGLFRSSVNVSDQLGERSTQG